MWIILLEYVCLPVFVICHVYVVLDIENFTINMINIRQILLNGKQLSKYMVSHCHNSYNMFMYIMPLL